MDLPASEIEYWREYYSIFPFPQERADTRTAMLAAVIANVSGKTLKRALSEKVFMPNYLGDVAPCATAATKSIEEQHAEFREFTSRYRAVVNEAKRVT